MQWGRKKPSPKSKKAKAKKDKRVDVLPGQLALVLEHPFRVGRDGQPIRM